MCENRLSGETPCGSLFIPLPHGVNGTGSSTNQVRFSWFVYAFKLRRIPSNTARSTIYSESRLSGFQKNSTLQPYWAQIRICRPLRIHRDFQSVQKDKMLLSSPIISLLTIPQSFKYPHTRIYIYVSQTSKSRLSNINTTGRIVVHKPS